MSTRNSPSQGGDIVTTYLVEAFERGIMPLSFTDAAIGTSYHAYSRDAVVHDLQRRGIYFAASDAGRIKSVLHPNNSSRQGLETLASNLALINLRLWLKHEHISQTILRSPHALIHAMRSNFDIVHPETLFVFLHVLESEGVAAPGASAAEVRQFLTYNREGIRLCPFSPDGVRLVPDEQTRLKKKRLRSLVDPSRRQSASRVLTEAIDDGSEDCDIAGCSIKSRQWEPTPGKRGGRSPMKKRHPRELVSVMCRIAPPVEGGEHVFTVSGHIPFSARTKHINPDTILIVRQKPGI